MTPAGMAALRIAATLVHALPGIAVRVRDRHRTLVEVAQPLEAGSQVMAPCAFRMAVARAHEQIKAGARLAFMGLPAGMEPAVDLALRAGDRVLPGGIYRVTLGSQTIHAFATTLAPRQCREVLHRAGAASAPVRLHFDAATEVTLVHTVSPAGEAADADQGRLDDLLAAIVAEELLHDLTGAVR